MPWIIPTAIFHLHVDGYHVKYKTSNTKGGRKNSLQTCNVHHYCVDYLFYIRH